MSSYPVHYRVEQPTAPASPLQLLIRIAAFCVLGMLGISFGSIFALAYVGLPVLAAIRISDRGAAAYVEGDGPRIAGALRWFAAVAAWAGLVSERLPARRPDETIVLEIEAGRAHLTAGAAMWRLITGLPSALVLCFLGWLGVFVWLWAALSILIARRVGPHAFDYLVGLQRWSIRLLAYQASLVDEYPPFSFAESSATVATPPATDAAAHG
jgi:hypothetical protein